MKEQSDDRERELKFRYGGGLEMLLDQLRHVTRPKWSLVTFPPRAIMDLYFDDDERTFRRLGATLRLRKRRLNPGWTMNFKSPPDPRETDFVDRREVISRVRVEEALLHSR